MDVDPTVPTDPTDPTVTALPGPAYRRPLPVPLLTGTALTVAVLVTTALAAGWWLTGRRDVGVAVTPGGPGAAVAAPAASAASSASSSDGGTDLLTPVAPASPLPSTSTPPMSLQQPAPAQDPVAAAGSTVTDPDPVLPATAWNNPNFPPAGVGASPQPLGHPSPPAAGGSFLVTSTQDDGVTPVAYDPCRPLRYVVRPDNAPPDGQAIVAEAFGAVAQATGLRVEYLGTTDEPPSLQRAAYQPDRYGQTWAPVVVAWVTPQEIPDVDGDVLGLGGSVSARAGTLPRVYVTGQVYLDGPQLSEIAAGPRGRAGVVSTVEHELGHVVGLAHVEDDTQLMFPQSRGQVLSFQAGDLAGLAILGQGACVPQL